LDFAGGIIRQNRSQPCPCPQLSCLPAKCDHVRHGCFTSRGQTISLRSISRRETREQLAMSGRVGTAERTGLDRRRKRLAFTPKCIADCATLVLTCQVITENCLAQKPRCLRLPTERCDQFARARTSARCSLRNVSLRLGKWILDGQTRKLPAWARPTSAVTRKHARCPSD
jgi:hypothetical protein